MKKFQRLLLSLERIYENLNAFNISLWIAMLIPVFIWFIRRRHLPPGPIAFPFIGNFHLIGNPNELVKRLLRLQRSYGNIFRLSLGSINTVVVLGHDLIREALIVKGEKFKYRPNWLFTVRKTKQDSGLTWGNGQKWQKLSSLSEMFVSRYISRKGIADSKINEEIQRIANDLFINKSRPINIRGMISMAVFNILCDLSTGERFDYGTKNGENLSRLIERLSDVSVTEMAENFFPLMRIFHRGKTLAMVTQTVDQVKSSIRERVMKHKETRTLSTIRDTCDVFLKSTSATDKEEENLTDEDVIQTLLDILIGGYEPTTSTLMWAFLFMVRYPNVQDQCRQEIKQAVAPGRPVTWNDKDKMPFTTATINEVQRLSNTVPISIPHVVSEDTELGKYKIPKDNTVIFHLYSSHMDPTYWKRPQEFRPEHFLDLDGKLIQHDAFFPYGLGIRSCPFFSLADRIIFLIFANMIRKFNFEKEEGHPLPSLESENGNVVFPKSYHVCPRPLD